MSYLIVCVVCAQKCLRIWSGIVWLKSEHADYNATATDAPVVLLSSPNVIFHDEIICHLVMAQNALRNIAYT